MKDLIVGLVVGVVIPGLLALGVELRKLILHYYEAHHHRHAA